MVEPNQPHPENPPLRGEQLALEMVQQLAALNQNMAARIELEKSQLALIDELNGRLETLTRACEIMGDKIADGKPKITIADFAEAMTQADEEIMGEEEEEDEGDIPARR